MARPLKTVRPVSKHLHFPADVYARMHIHLWDTALRRMPVGAIQEFLVELIKDFFNRGTVKKSLPPSKLREAYDLIATVRDLASHPSSTKESLPLIAAWSKEAGKLLLEEETDK